LGILVLGSLILNRQDAKSAKQSEKTTNQTANPRAISSGKAATPIKIFVTFRVVRG
jgi:hypothetical protein